MKSIFLWKWLQDTKTDADKNLQVRRCVYYAWQQKLPGKLELEITILGEICKFVICGEKCRETLRCIENIVRNNDHFVREFGKIKEEGGDIRISISMDSLYIRRLYFIYCIIYELYNRPGMLFLPVSLRSLRSFPVTASSII